MSARYLPLRWLYEYSIVLIDYTIGYDHDKLMESHETFIANFSYGEPILSRSAAREPF